MATALISIRPPAGTVCSWTLELDAELDADEPAATAERVSCSVAAGLGSMVLVEARWTRSVT